MNIFATRARLTENWAHNVRIGVSDGSIHSIQKNTAAKSGDICVDTLLPALANLHSHSFQRAMAGMTEFRAEGRDSFWTWRDLMYRFVDRLTPEHIQAFAAMTFMEMQKTGFASVGEFHYIHHQTNGRPYDNPAELSQRIFQASTQTGIGLTHLPVLYTCGGANAQPLVGGQLRFGNSAHDFLGIVAACQKVASSHHSDTRVGIAPHSLRATNPVDLAEVLALHPEGPVHIHIAEQVQEVEEIQAVRHARPVEWLFDNAPVNRRWCLIHATHMNEHETALLAKSGAVAGLCPITEANLGDGIFNGPAYIKNGGQFGIGSDSNVNISLTEELRTLEYSQRLRDRRRNLMVPGAGSVGEALYLNAAKGGALALNRDCGHIKTGALADLVAIDTNDPALCALDDTQILDGLVFAAKDHVVTDLWSAGRHQVRNRRHVAEDQIISGYRTAIADLMS